jgi:hypothetical protein
MLVPQATTHHERVEFPAKETSEYTSFLADYNSGQAMKTHKYVRNTLGCTLLVIHAFGGSENDSISPVKLGLFTFKLNEIERKCPWGGNWEPVSKTSSHLVANSNFGQKIACR